MSEDMTTWRILLNHEMERRTDSGPIKVAPSGAVLDVEFDSGYGGPEGTPFLAWTSTRVYFPICYDGAASVKPVPRNPQPTAEGHVGGW